MVGQVLGAVGHLPSIYTELEVSYYLLRRLLGVRTEGKPLLKKKHVFLIRSNFSDIIRYKTTDRYFMYLTF